MPQHFIAIDTLHPSQLRIVVSWDRTDVAAGWWLFAVDVDLVAMGWGTVPAFSPEDLADLLMIEIDSGIDLAKAKVRDGVPTIALFPPQPRPAR